MKIVGIEGMTPDDIRSGVQHGGSFALYSYCISLVFVSFKRPSSIYYIPPGQSRLTKGLPFVGISFLLGWWGIPWGIFYTIEVLVKNLGGGIDVTDDILANLAPASAPAVDPLPRPASTRPRSSSRVGLVRFVALIAFVVSVAWSVWSYQLGQNVPVALGNGLTAPYDLELDGQTYTLRPGQATVVTLAEGRHDYVAHFPGGIDEVGTFAFSSPFSARPTRRFVGLFNPDRLALFYRETTEYRASSTDSAPDLPVSYYFGSPFLHLPAADFFFELFPPEISLPSSTTIERRERFAQVSGATPLQVLAWIENTQSREAWLTHLNRLGALFPADEEVLRLAYESLSADEGRRFFATHLDALPVQLEWHRFYQWFAQAHRLSPDLAADYLRRLEAAPGNGALHYLTGRVVADRADRLAHYQRATESTDPCAYGYLGLSAEAEAVGDFAAALDFVDRAVAAGLTATVLDHSRYELLLANQRADDALAEVRQKRAETDDYTLFTRHLALVAQQTETTVADTDAIIDDYLRTMGAEWPDETRQSFRAHARGIAAGIRNDRDGFISGMLAGGTVFGRFYAELYRGDHAAALELIPELGSPDSFNWSMAYLAAEEAGDSEAAATSFSHLVDLLETDGPESSKLAHAIKAGEVPSAAAVLNLNGFLFKKIAYVTALGRRYPELRAPLHAWADQHDFVPGFPREYLRALRHPVPPADSTATGSL